MMFGEPVAGAAATWRMLRASVRGAAHHRAGLPNQDAVRIVRCAVSDGDDDTTVVLALADGHDSPKSFRSRQGARLAVTVALKVAGHLPPTASPSQRKRGAEEQWPLELVRGWQEAMERRLARQPFTAADLAALDEQGRRQVEARPALAYGSTLISVIVAPVSILYLQLGDGDLLTVSADGQVARPIPSDARRFGNDTPRR